jgi:hypothetical protein
MKRSDSVDMKLWSHTGASEGFDERSVTVPQESGRRLSDVTEICFPSPTMTSALY